LECASLRANKFAMRLHGLAIITPERRQQALPLTRIFLLIDIACVHIPGQVGHLFQSKLATHSDVKLAACSGAMLATFSDIPEWVAKMSPE